MTEMDLKIDGLPIDILKEALDQAKEGRLHILDEMKKCLSEPRKKLSEHAPKMLMTNIPVDKIGLVIGQGGKNIKELQGQLNQAHQRIKHLGFPTPYRSSS